MKKITKEKLIEILKKQSAAAPITIVAKTNPAVVKGAPEILKKSRVNGFTAARYENSVHNQEMREDHFPSFVAKPRVWGKRSHSALVTHKGNSYLVIHPIKSRRPVFYIGKKKVDDDEICDFLVAKKEPNQPIVKKIYYRNFSIDNIVGVVFNNICYRIKN